MGAWKKIWFAVTAVGGLAVTAASISPQDAVSNLGKWAELIGLPSAASWLMRNQADSWAIVIGTTTIVIGLGMLIYPKVITLWGEPITRRILFPGAVLFCVGMTIYVFRPERIAEWCGKIEGLSQAEGIDDEIKQPSIIRLVRIAGLPYSATFEARGGALGLRIKNRDTGRVDFVSGPNQMEPEGIRSVVQNPRGLYEVTVIAKNPNAVVLTQQLKCEP